MPDKGLKIYCDGGARGNPGPAAAAFVIIKDSKVIGKGSKFLGNATNNFAEYQSGILALKWLVNNQHFITNRKVSVILDSELVVSQLSGDYKIKSESLRPLYLAVKNLEKKISAEISFLWSPRTKNKLADFLVNKELDKNS
jgi:ribonuclease HI